MAAYAGGDLAAARDALIRAAESDQVARFPEYKAFLQRALASVLLEIGDESGARACLAESEITDSGSPVALFYSASLLANRLKDFDSALEKAKRALGVIESSREGERHLTAQLLALRGRCEISLGRMSEATQSMRELASLKDEGVVEHAIELCEACIAGSVCEDIAREYLAFQLDRLVAGGDEKDTDLRRYIAALLR